MPGSDITVTNVASKAQPETVALFVSDVHLQSSLPLTTQAFLAFLARHVRRANQLYLLGDLFEYWAGDDDIETPYNAMIAAAIRDVSNAGIDVFWIAGNRDFLVGEKFAESTGLRLVTEPFIADIGGQRVALVHGDAQCTDDRAYMAFREKVRAPEWQHAFLAMPLVQRKAIIDGMRAGSREAQRTKSYEIMDVNPDAIASLFIETGCSMIIHGHTHRPATHEHNIGDRACARHVLPDWDCDSQTPRGGWLSLGTQTGLRRYGVDGIERPL